MLEIRSALRDIEPQIEDRRAVSDPARRDQIDPGGGDRRRALAGDPARGFGHRAAGDHRDGAAQRVGVHVVEQHRVDPVFERLGELVERIDFELDLDEMPGMGARPLERRPDPAGDRHVVVLDQHRVVEAEAVVGAPAQAHRLLFEDAQPRGGLARADDPRLRAGDRIDQRAGRGGDAGEPANEV